MNSSALKACREQSQGITAGASLIIDMVHAQRWHGPLDNGPARCRCISTLTYHSVRPILHEININPFSKKPVHRKVHVRPVSPSRHAAQYLYCLARHTIRLAASGWCVILDQDTSFAAVHP